jgi:hypothetical protein
MPNDSEWFNNILAEYTRNLIFTNNGMLTYNTPLDSMSKPEIQYVKKYNKELSKSLDKMIYDEIDNAFNFIYRISNSKDLAYTVRLGNLIIYRKNKKTEKSIGLFKGYNGYNKEKINAVSLYKSNNFLFKDKNILQTICHVRIKSFSQSGDLFGYKPTKELMMKSNQLFEINDVLFDYKCKKDEVLRNVIEVAYKDKSLKFVYEDLEFIYPDVEILRKGYTEPIDRTIRRNSKVKIIDDRKIPLKRNSVFKVSSVVLLGDSMSPRKYCNIVHDSKEYLISSKRLKVIA